jgi:hypothetical protein
MSLDGDEIPGHTAKPSNIRHKCVRWLVSVSKGDWRFEYTAMKGILKHLQLPTMKQIIKARILRYPEQVALMPGGRLTHARETFRSQAKPRGHSKERDQRRLRVATCRI